MAERLVLDDLVATFKEAWEAADDAGREGERTRAGLEAILEELCLADGDIVSGQPGDVQNLMLSLGDAFPVYVEDTVSGADLRELIDSPIQRAVVVARLRTAADLLEGGDE